MVEARKRSQLPTTKNIGALEIVTNAVNWAILHGLVIANKSSHSSIAKVEKQMKKVGRTFANLKKDLEQIKEEESDISDSDSESSDEEDQDASASLNFTVPTPKSQELAQQIHNNKDSAWKLDMRKVILLDNESTTHLFCNSDLVEGIHTVKNSMTVKGNGGKLKTKQQAVDKALQQAEGLVFQ